MDVRQLRFFLAVAEYGSVTSASEALYTAQPALSQAIRALEDELGIELFHRVPRGMELSAAGAALLGPAHQIAHGVADAHDTVQAIAELRQGRLDVVAPADLAFDPLVDMVARFRAAYPGVWVNLRDVGELGNAATVVHSAGCEVGLGYLPVKAQVVAHVLGRREFSLALPPGYRRRRSVTLREIADVSLILPPRGTVVRDLVEVAWSDLGVEPRVVIETDHLGSVHRLVRAGVGAAFLPPAFAEWTASLGAVVVGTTPVLGQDFGLLHRDGVLSPAARAFVALAAEPQGRDLQR